MLRERGREREREGVTEKREGERRGTRGVRGREGLLERDRVLESGGEGGG